MAEFVALCAADMRFMAGRPGFVGARIHRGTAGSKVLYQVVEWDSTEALAAAIAAAAADPAMRERSNRMPAGITLYLHIFETATLAGPIRHGRPVHPAGQKGNRR